MSIPFWSALGSRSGLFLDVAVVEETLAEDALSARLAEALEAAD